VSTVTLHLGDCLAIMPTLPPQSVDAIITDLPYGTTACAWDEVIPFAPMWEQVKRVLKPRGVFVTTASQPFTSALIMSNVDWFRYEWIWEKSNAVDFALAEKRPRKLHENIITFSQKGHDYHPQMERGKPYVDKPRKRSNNIHKFSMPNLGIENKGTRYPSSVQFFGNGNNDNDHPTQKPVALYEYLILTYTNAGDTVLDICAGSGTTGVAAILTGRNAILIEKDAGYFAIAERRIHDALQQPNLFEVQP
jgi:DNA modification methylase